MERVEGVDAALLPVEFPAPDPDTPDVEVWGLVEVVSAGIGFASSDESEVETYPGIIVPPDQGLKFVVGDDLLPVRFAGLIEQAKLEEAMAYGLRS